jgi:hypothetical protein
MSERAFNEMKTHATWDTLKKNHSKGSLYRGLEEFEPFMEKRYAEVCDRVSKKLEEETLVNDKIKAEKTKLRQIKGESRRLEEEKVKLSASKLKLVTENKKITETLKADRTKLGRIQDKLQAISGRGITEEILTDLLGSDIDSPEVLLKRVTTLKEFEKVEVEKRGAEEELEKIRDETEKDQENLGKIQEETRSAQNLLDHLRTQNLFWQEALSVTVHCLEQGYTSQMLIELLNALQKLSIKKEPLVSVRRLLGGLEKVKELIELEDALIRTSAQYKTLTAKLADTEGIFKTLNKLVLGSIKKAEKKAVQSIDLASNRAQGSILEYVNSLKNVETQALESINILEKEAENALNRHQQSVSAFFLDNSYAVQLAIATYEEKIKHYSNLREEIGILKPWIDLATILYGANQDPHALQRVNLSTVRRICEGIHFYVAGRWPSIRMRVPREISDNDLGILSGSEIGLLSVICLLVEGIRKLEREGNA